MTTTNSTSERPVKCKLCSGQMYYAGDERHRAEVRVEVYEKPDRTFEAFRAHKECWEKWLTPLSLLDSEAAELYPPVTDTGRGRCRHNVPTCGECQVNEVLAHVAEKEQVAGDAATRMRDLCVEKVKTDNHKDDAEYERAVQFVLHGVITALQSLTLEQEQKQK